MIWGPYVKIKAAIARLKFGQIFGFQILSSVQLSSSLVRLCAVGREQYTDCGVNRSTKFWQDFC